MKAIRSACVDQRDRLWHYGPSGFHLFQQRLPSAKRFAFLAPHPYVFHPYALGHAKGDGEPVCFSNSDDTGVPEVQSWCHQLTSNSRQRCATNLLRQLRSILATIRSYVGSRYNISPSERALLQRKWQTPVVQQMTTSEKRFKHSPDSEGDLNTLLHDRGIMPRLKQVIPAFTIDIHFIYLYPRSLRRQLMNLFNAISRAAFKRA